MPWYSVVYNFILVFWVSVSISVVRIAKLLVARVRRKINPAPLIELPVTSPTPPISYIAVACGHTQRLVTIVFASVHNLVRRISYTIVWQVPMYMRRIAKSFHCLRVAVLNFLANGLLRLAKAIHDTSDRPAVWNTKSHDAEYPNILIHIRDSVSNDLSSSRISEYAPLSNVSTLNLDQTAASIYNGPSANSMQTPASGATLSESDSNWGLTPSDSFFCSESASFQSSLTTPSQSPDQAFFNNLTLACKSDLDNGISLVEAKLSAKGLDSSGASINSFGQIERLFEDNYGKPASLTADEFFSSLGKQFIAPAAPISVFSASVHYDASPRSSVNVRLNALVSGNNSANSSFDGVYITTAMVGIEDRLQGSSLDVSSPESDRSTFELSVACSGKITLWKKMSLLFLRWTPRRFSSIEVFFLRRNAIDVFSSRDSFDLSSVILSPQESILSQESLDPSSEPSSVQTSAVSSPLYSPLSPAIVAADGLPYLHPTFSQDLSNAQTLPSKKANRQARVTNGLAIDINALSPSIITSIYEPSPLINSEFSLPTPSGFSIPSIVVSPVSEDTSSLASSSPELAVTDFIGQKNDTSGVVQLLHGTNRHGSEPVVEHSTPAQANSCTQNNMYVYPVLRSPSRAAGRDSGSRRVGLRGSLPRYRFSTLPNETTADASTPTDARSLASWPPPDRRVGLLGTAPRQRFAPTLAPPTSAVALLARAAHEARERAAVLERHRARAQFFAQRDAAHSHGLRPLLLPLSVAARAGSTGGVPGRSASPTRFWGVPF
ncbi:hypothetical protein BJ912DRAFT_943547 [Pholiota molesta]|nr:hypothetical protein BJ912DRAFT_943547 [Pholiota molesta]